MPTNPLNSQNWTSESTGLTGSTSSPSGSGSGGGNPPGPQCTCCCDCNEGQGGQQPLPAKSTTNGSLGIPVVSGPALSQNGGGGGNQNLKDNVEYSGNGSGAGGGKYGEDWVNPNQPVLRFSGGSVLVESGPVETVKFKSDGTGYKAEYFVRDILTYDAATERYTMTSTKGERKVFDKGGTLRSMKDAHGNETVFTYDIDGNLLSMVTGTGANAVGYFYTFTAIAGMKRQTKVVMRVGGITNASDYRQIQYFYTATGQLKKVLLDEMRNGVWSEIETSYYRYFATGSKRLRFVLNDHAYEQMHSVNPNWPESATDAELSTYADVEYAYGSGGRISQVKTNGGKYTFDFRYGVNQNAFGSDPGVWKSKTTVTNPDGSTNTFYYNEALSLLLMKVSAPRPGGGVDEWYPICQQFDENMRIILDAQSSAVASVNESWPTLFTLKPDVGAVRVYDYDANGYRTLVALKKGAHGPNVNQQSITYTPRTVDGNTIYLPASVTEYRDATDSAASNPVTTSYAYTWYTGTYQLKTATVTLPAVPNAENGDAQTATVRESFDTLGFLTEQIDAVGMKTTYEYYVDTGALKRQVVDAGRLNLTTDYDVDPLGRTVRTLGPVHTISLNGIATDIRQTQWTQYLDSEDETRSISGYVKVSDSSEHMINPVQISRNFVLDPQVTGGRREENIAVKYFGSGIPPESHNFPQSDFVRWDTQHFDKKNELTHSRLYHHIPDSGPGESGADYAQTNYDYDTAGRQNKTTSPGGTISLTEYNAMSWTLRSRTGTTDANLHTTSINEYDNGAAGGDGNVTKVTSRVESSTASDRIVIFRYDWRDRRIETETNDGTRTLLTRRTYDNRNNVTQADEYQTSITAANLINRAESFYDTRNRQYRTKRYGVDVGTGTLQPALTSEIYYDQAGRTVRSTPAGKVGFSVTEYDTAGRTRRQYRAYGGTLNPNAPGNIDSAIVLEQSGFHYDAAGNSTYVSFRQRFDDAPNTATGPLLGPTGPQPNARRSYVATYPDALGRNIATANYGTNGGETWTRPTTIPSRSDTVLVSNVVFNAAGEQEETIDPMGTVTRQEYDAAGRVIKLIENFKP